MIEHKEEWQIQALKMDGIISRRKIAEALGVKRSTCLDFLRKYSSFVGEKEMPSDSETTHLWIPDNQVKPGVDLSYLDWVGQYIVRKRPTVIINAGDFADMEGASSYDVGKRSAEGKRIQEDIDVAKKGMDILLKPLRDLQAQQLVDGEEVYSPRLVMLLGNHEHRINRHVDENPALYGLMSTDSLGYAEAGWEVYPFLTPVVIDGIAYCHYFTNNMTGKPLGGNALNMLKQIGTSFTQGHKQTLDVATRFLPATGQQQWGIIAGACYSHDEDYKGVQGNHHWRGIIVKHRVKDGSYDPLFISLDWLESEYGSNNE